MAERAHVNKVIPLPAYLAEDEMLAKLIEAARECANGLDQVAAPFIAAATQELIDRGSKFAPPPSAEEIAEAKARKAAEPLGWREGGGYVYDSNVFDSWKEAVSWSGDDGRDEREQSSNLYSTWQECCAGEDIEVAV